MPKVSVIIPNFNHAAYLPLRIDSVLNQTFTDFELIILDDASPDNSREIIEKYASENPWIITSFNKKNSGSPFAQWNKGAEMAKGEYLWFAESDDYCKKDFLESLVLLLDKNPGVGIANCQSYLVNEENEILNSYRENLEFIYKNHQWEKSFLMNGQDACRELLVFHNPIPNASGALLRKSVYQKVGMADPLMHLNGDWFLYTKMLSVSDWAFCARHLNYFRVHLQTQRERARATPKVYDEMISINNFIRTHVSGSEENAQKALVKFGDWWQGGLYYQDWSRSNLKHNYSLFQFFKKRKKHLLLKITQTLAIETTRSLMQATGILTSAKKIRKRLFPGKYFEY